MKNDPQPEIKKIIKEFSKLDKIELPNSFPPIKELVECKITIKLISKEIIETCTGYKLIIRGNKILNLNYLNEDSTKNLICKKFIIPFYNAIQIPSGIKRVKVNLNLSYCDLRLLNKCNILFFNIITIWLSFCECSLEPELIDSSSKECNDNWSFKNNCLYNEKFNNYIINSCSN